ncbi:signal peptidase II [Mesomycoplasma hyorhinis]|uniref:signal peptidase II n=1 Tax=Mesomycoplasma hyorhinis TaxID=2100 RepID=UPI0011B7D03E|nr:signal peptidase II [Mesomycoplasma hyorhinis]MXR07959.1 signal peptidase II [Mesomycoplasma hyorhinis]MXR58002.1 signal peptidase II [Mesomycoplasma hyorhinis]QEA01692.1 signal peptidase II [Mesomycoplasma hyorhinis]
MKISSVKIKNFVKTILTRVPKKRILYNAIFLFVFLLILLLIDQLTKNLIFKHEDFNEYAPDEKLVINHGWIGFRPLLHRGVTSGLAKVFGFTIIHIFSFLLLFILIISVLLSKNYFFATFMIILLAGNIGNELDRLLYQNGVKDIIFIPYRDKGTFNFADIFIISGPIGMVVIMVFEIGWPTVNKWYKNQKHKTSINEENNNQN